MAPKRKIQRTGTIDCFFKKIDRDGNVHGQEQNNSPIVANRQRTPEPEQQRSVDAPNPEEHRTAQEAPRQPAPKVQRVNAEIENASVLIVERDLGLRKQFWEYPANERDQVHKVYLMHGPYQFHMDTYPASGLVTHPHRFQSHWYNDFPWLEYSPAKYAAFCFPCFLFSKKPSGKAGSDTFTVKGFRTWRKVNQGANCSFLVHMGSDSKSAHNYNMKCYENLKNTAGHIEHVVEKQTQEEIKKSCLRLGTSVDVVRYLAFQACPFRGHDESATSKNQGNFHEMVKLLASYNEEVNAVVLDNGPQNAKYTSPQIQKQIFDVMASKLQSAILL